MTARALNLLKGLNVVMLRPVHDTQDFSREFRLISRPLARRTVIRFLHEIPTFCVRRYRQGWGELEVGTAKNVPDLPDTPYLVGSLGRDTSYRGISIPAIGA